MPSLWHFGLAHTAPTVGGKWKATDPSSSSFTARPAWPAWTRCPLSPTGLLGQCLR